MWHKKCREGGIKAKETHSAFPVKMSSLSLVAESCHGQFETGAESSTKCIRERGGGYSAFFFCSVGGKGVRMKAAETGYSIVAWVTDTHL